MNSTKILTPFLAFQQDGINVLSSLAQWGEDDVVDALLTYKTCSTKDAVYGYALSGEKDRVSDLIKVLTEPEKEECIRKAVRGYARGGHFGSVYSIPGYKKYLGEFLAGAAEGGHVNTVQRFLNENRKLFKQVVEGYATGNCESQLLVLLRNTHFYPDAVYYAACAGHAPLTSKLLENCGFDAKNELPCVSEMTVSDSYHFSLLNYSLKGYLEGRHFPEAVAVLALGASRTQAVLDLKNSLGLPDHDLYMAFLAHVANPVLRKNLIDEINSQSEITSIRITMEDIVKLDRITLTMTESSINFIAACHTLNEEPLTNIGEKSISLSCLRNAVEDWLETCGYTKMEGPRSP